MTLCHVDQQTGGDLFGTWHDANNTAVIRLVVGPGKHAARNETSFRQDAAYLQGASGIAVFELGLQQVFIINSICCWTVRGPLIGWCYMYLSVSSLGPSELCLSEVCNLCLLYTYHKACAICIVCTSV